MSPSQQLPLVLGIILASSKLAGSLSQRLGQPSVLGELVAGLILGPTALNLLHLVSAAPTLEPVLSAFAELGVILLMFLAGVETDLAALRSVGPAALSAALGGVLLPFASGTALMLKLGSSTVEAAFVGAVFTATSVSITAETLLELGQLKSREGATILGAAVVDDVLGILLLSAVIALSGARTGESSLAPALLVLILVGRMAGFVAAALFSAKFLESALRWVSTHLKGNEAPAALALALVLGYAWAAERLGGVATITGSYLAGALVSRSQLAHEVEDRLRVPIYALFVPVFLIHIGLQIDARCLVRLEPFAASAVVGAAVLSKLAGAGLGAAAAGFSGKEALRVGVGMVSRGEVALIVTSAGVRAGLVPERLFSLMVIMTLGTTLVTPLLLRLTFSKTEAA